MEAVAHGWDLARATGQVFEADEAAIAGSLEFAESMSAPGAEAARAPAFGPVVAVTEGATTLDRLVALTGRDPTWTMT